MENQKYKTRTGCLVNKSVNAVGFSAGIITLALFCTASVSIANSESEPANQQFDLAITDEMVSEAQQGDPFAQCKLGFIYFERKDEQVVEWVEKAANQDISACQELMGHMYETGIFLEVNTELSAIWYEKAEKQSHMDDTYSMARTYHHNAEKQDLEKAVELYKRAGELGHAESYYELGSNMGLIKDSDEKVKWFKKAAELGHEKAQNTLGEIYREGSLYRQLFLRDSEIQIDISESIKWHAKAAEQGNVDSQNTLGAIYETGAGVEKKFLRAANWYKKAAEQGDAKGQFNFGRINYIGKGVPTDFKTAEKWLKKASNQGHSEASFFLANLYSDEKFGGANLEKSFELFLNSAKLGNKLAIMKTGYNYVDGNGVEKNNIEAYAWLNLLASTGDDDAITKRDELEEIMTPSELTEAQEKSARYFAELTRKNN